VRAASFLECVQRELPGMRYLACLLAAVFLFLAGPGPSSAADLRALVEALAQGSFDDREKAIAALASSGDPRAAPVIEALGAGKLHLRKSDGTIIIVKDGTMLDAVVGTRVTANEAELERVRVNNRLRRAIEAALGSLTLMSPDSGVRRQAAEAVFKSRDPGAIPALDAAIAAEKDEAIRAVMMQARAAAVLGSDARESEKIEALKAVSGRADRDALGLLATVGNQSSGAVKDAADAAARRIERSLAIWEAGQNVWYGLSLGSVLLLAAIGLAITFGVMGVINMAHGEMVMLGAYTTFLVQ
jgi:urea transport system permease protein